jgi:DNA-binding HxlR family transcriptional regulator
MTPSTFASLDPVIHAPVRLAVISLLVSVREADFVYLKTATGTSDGNLSVHLTKLEEAGYIRVRKSFRGKKPSTTCSLTEKGRTAFLDYLKSLESYIPHNLNQGKDK